MPTPDQAPRRQADRLDQPIRVLSGQLWAGLLALAVVAAGTVVWGVLGDIPQRVSASGVLVGASGVKVAQSSVSGSVVSVAVPTGATVVAGQRLATVEGAHGQAAVRSPVAGTVVDTLAVPGQSVQAGTPLAIVEPTGEVDRALLFVAAAQVAELQTGDRVTIGVGAAQLLEGTVSDVNPVPLSRIDVTDQLGTAEAPGLPTGGSPAFEIVADLMKPPRALPAFAEVDASILVGSQRPYEVLVG